MNIPNRVGNQKVGKSLPNVIPAMDSGTWTKMKKARLLANPYGNRPLDRKDTITAALFSASPVYVNGTNVNGDVSGNPTPCSCTAPVPTVGTLGIPHIKTFCYEPYCAMHQY